MKHLKTCGIICMILFSMITAAQAQTDKTSTLKVGDTLPEVKVVTLEEQTIGFPSTYAGQPLVIIFYRAQWSNICMDQLAEFQAYNAQLVKMGYKVIVVGAEPLEIMKETKKIKGIKFTMLCDEDKIALAKYGNGQGAIPIASIFITDKNNVIRYIYCNPDYKTRPVTQEVIDLAQKLRTQYP